jgi:hypothetical protein
MLDIIDSPIKLITREPPIPTVIYIPFLINYTNADISA